MELSSPPGVSRRTISASRPSFSAWSIAFLKI